jgi:hypothetical protein
MSVTRWDGKLHSPPKPCSIDLIEAPFHHHGVGPEGLEFLGVCQVIGKGRVVRDVRGLVVNVDVTNPDCAAIVEHVLHERTATKTLRTHA